VKKKKKKKEKKEKKRRREDLAGSDHADLQTLIRLPPFSHQIV